MSLKEDPSCENHQETEDEELDPEHFYGKDVLLKDFQKTSQAEKRTTLYLCKEDFSQFKEGHPRMNQPEKLIRPLTLLRQDFNHFKEDLSSVFRIRHSKERDHEDVTVKDVSSSPSRTKTSKTERTDEPPKSLFRRDKSSLKTSHKVKSRKFRKGKGNQLDVNASDDKNETKNPFTQIEQDDGSDDCCSAEDEPSKTQRSRGITLFSLRDDNEVNLGDPPAADLWSVKRFACYLTFDPNTANSELHLSEGNRRATRVWKEHRLPEHPERFGHCPQVLCREGLLDPAYWEVDWTGGADVGVTYNNISRDGGVENCLLGHTECSWSLECSEGCYTPCHNGRRFKSSSPEPFTRRVGVYLNPPAGSLSFYCVSPDTVVHLHTFTCTFTEPLYPGFWAWAYDGSVSLCQVELDWERLGISMERLAISMAEPETIDIYT